MTSRDPLLFPHIIATSTLPDRCIMLPLLKESSKTEGDIRHNIEWDTLHLTVCYLLLLLFNEQCMRFHFIRDDDTDMIEQISYTISGYLCNTLFLFWFNFLKKITENCFKINLVVGAMKDTVSFLALYLCEDTKRCFMIQFFVLRKGKKEHQLFFFC